MNIKKIISTFDQHVDQNENKSFGRRDFFKSAGSFGKQAAMVAAPAIILALLPKAAFAKTATIPEVLNFALTLEYLEDEFYKAALAASGLIPESDRAIFMQISKHESAHVAFLKTALGTSAIAKPTFDFTAGGTFPDALTNYTTFLALSQSFEDTGVRAYKGQAGNLISDNGTLKAALQIHSVEARHASEVRRLRGANSGMTIKGWITGDQSNGAPAAIYAGEDNQTQGTANLASLSSLSSISADAKTEAFDEALTKEQVLAIVTPFVKS
ncbi:MAG: ferritin-like domain-containing protein [Bacteroidota bacterium]